MSILPCHEYLSFGKSLKDWSKPLMCRVSLNTSGTRWRVVSFNSFPESILQFSTLSFFPHLSFLLRSLYTTLNYLLIQVPYLSFFTWEMRNLSSKIWVLWLSYHPSDSLFCKKVFDGKKKPTYDMCSLKPPSGSYPFRHLIVKQRLGKDMKKTGWEERLRYPVRRWPNGQ